MKKEELQNELYYACQEGKGELVLDLINKGADMSDNDFACIKLAESEKQDNIASMLCDIAISKYIGKINDKSPFILLEHLSRHYFTSITLLMNDIPTVCRVSILAGLLTDSLKKYKKEKDTNSQRADEILELVKSNIKKTESNIIDFSKLI